MCLTLQEEAVEKVSPNQIQVKTEKSVEQVLTPQESVQSETQEEAQIIKELSENPVVSDPDTDYSVIFY